MTPGSPLPLPLEDCVFCPTGTLGSPAPWYAAGEGGTRRRNRGRSRSPGRLGLREDGWNLGGRVNKAVELRMQALSSRGGRRFKARPGRGLCKSKTGESTLKNESKHGGEEVTMRASVTLTEERQLSPEGWSLRRQETSCHQHSEGREGR